MAGSPDAAPAERQGHLTPGQDGRPDTFPDGRPTVGPGAQLLSYLVNLVVSVGPAVGVWFLTGSIVLTALALVEVLALLVLVRARTGITPGGLALGLRVARRGNHLAPGLAREAVRSGVMGGAHLTVVGGLVTALSGFFDPQRRGRGWHDRVAGTRSLPTRRLAREATRAAGERRVSATMEPVPAERIDLGREVTHLGADPRHGSGARRD
ncbi:MAG: RDD family protein [Actinomycetaceae bacterium]